MRITLGTACLSDLDLIHVIRRDAILGVPAGAGLPDRQAWAASRSPSCYADRLAAGQVVLARVAGEAIGWGSSAEAWITGLYVRAAWSRRGIGRTLMAHLETAIAQRGHACAPGSESERRRLLHHAGVCATWARGWGGRSADDETALPGGPAR